MDSPLESIRAQKDRLDRMRPLVLDALKGLQKFYDVGSPIRPMP
jgi:hypothetical protein